MTNCKRCDAVILRDGHAQYVRCPSCKQQNYMPREREQKTCEHCKASFEGLKSRKFCSTDCGKAFFKAKYEASKTVREGVYVYLWFDDCATLPYYVGSGTGTRAEQQHVGLRDPARVEIVRQGLTREEALLVESTLIKALKLVGATLVNVANPMA